MLTSCKFLTYANEPYFDIPTPSATMYVTAKESVQYTSSHEVQQPYILLLYLVRCPPRPVVTGTWCSFLDKDHELATVDPACMQGSECKCK